MATDTAPTSVPIAATSALTAAIFAMTAPISGVISAICAVICASGASKTRQGIWPISAAIARIFGAIEGTCDATVAICSLIGTVINPRVTRPRRLETTGPFRFDVCFLQFGAAVSASAKTGRAGDVWLRAEAVSCRHGFFATFVK